MILKEISSIEKKPLEIIDISTPEPHSRQILVKISVCGICHTELDEVEGRLPPSKLPIILGHQIVGTVKKFGSEATRFKEGERVGITWLNSICGRCSFCLEGKENLCDEARWTGKDVHGGYAQYTLVSEEFAHRIPESFSDSSVAPMLCAGVIGYRALKLSGLRNGQILGLYGFGASAHIVIQIAKYLYPDSMIFVFTRSQDHRDLAERLGACWTGGAEDNPPEKIDRAIDFTPVGQTIREALRAIQKGGGVVVNAIRKENPIPELDYARHLWQEKEIRSVSNVTRKDVEELLPLAAKIPIIPTTQQFELEDANEALILLKQGRIQGAGILRIPK